MRLIYKIIILPLFLMAALSASASGVKVDPPKLEMAARPNESLSREITVSNPTSDVQIFKAYPDDFSDIIKVNPASFILEAGMKKDVTLTVEIKDDRNALAALNTNISVVAKPLAEAGFQTSAGVKIPLSVTISAENSQGRIASKVLKPPAFIFISLLIIAGALAYFLRRKKKTASQ